MELSNDEGDDDMEGRNENYICTLLDEDEWECGQRWPTARALAAHQRHTRGEHTVNRREWQVWWSQISAFVLRFDTASVETTSKHMAAAERHNRCVVDAGRFHFPVRRNVDDNCKHWSKAPTLKNSQRCRRI